MLNNPLQLVDPTGLEDKELDDRGAQGKGDQQPQPPPPPPPKPVDTQRATLPDASQCHMCFGQVPTTVVVDQVNNPGPRVRNVDGTDQLVVGVDLTFTFLDQNGDAVNGTVSESVEPQVTQATKPFPLDAQGRAADLVSNSLGSVPV